MSVASLYEAVGLESEEISVNGINLTNKTRNDLTRNLY